MRLAEELGVRVRAGKLEVEDVDEAVRLGYILPVSGVRIVDRSAGDDQGSEQGR